MADKKKVVTVQKKKTSAKSKSKAKRGRLYWLVISGAACIILAIFSLIGQAIGIIPTSQQRSATSTVQAQTQAVALAATNDARTATQAIALTAAKATEKAQGAQVALMPPTTTFTANASVTTTNTPVITQSPTITDTPALAPSATITDAPQPAVGSVGNCPSLSATCAQLSSCEQAIACLAAGNFRLDPDGDGVPCESLCTGDSVLSSPTETRTLSSTVQTWYTKSQTNARACPKTDNTICAVVYQLTPGTAVTYVDFEQGETVSGSDIWYKVSYDGRDVYIHSSLLQNTPLTPTIEPVQMQQAAPVNVQPAQSQPQPPASIISSDCSCAADTLNCGSFTSQQQAQACYAKCMAEVGRDIHGLDGNDKDQLACDSHKY